MNRRDREGTPFLTARERMSVTVPLILAVQLSELREHDRNLNYCVTSRTELLPALARSHPHILGERIASYELLSH
jgi:hypothetical protein